MMNMFELYTKVQKLHSRNKRRKIYTKHYKIGIAAIDECNYDLATDHLSIAHAATSSVRHLKRIKELLADCDYELYRKQVENDCWG